MPGQANDFPSQPTKPRISRTVTNVLSNWAGLFVACLVSFFLSPFIVNHLGDTGYGVWVLAASLTGYLGLLDLGVRGAVTRFVAKYHVERSHEEASQITSSAFNIYVLTGIVVVLLSFALAKLATLFFKIPQEYQTVVPVVIILSGFGIAVSLVSGVFGGVVAGLQRFDWQNGIEIASALLRSLAIVLLLSKGYGLVSLAVIHLVFGTLTGIAYTWASFHLYPQLRLKFAYFGRENVTLIFSFGFYSTLLDISRLVIFYSDSVVISSFLPVAFVTFFAIAANLVTYARALIRGVSTIMLPMASSAEVRGGNRALQEIVLQGSKFATLAILPIALTFIVRGRTFIGLWMGQAYSEPSGHALWILSLGLIFLASNLVGSAIALGVSKHKMLVPISLMEALLNLGLSVLLVRSMGIGGVAWGTTIPSLLVSVLYWPWFFRKQFNIQAVSFMISTWVKPGIACIPFVACVYAIERLWPASNLPLFFVQVALTLPLVILGAWFLVLDESDKAQIVERVVKPAFSLR